MRSTDYLKPEAVRKLIQRSRRMAIFLSFEISLPTADGRHYPHYQSLHVTAAQALKVVSDAKRFRELKLERHPGTPEAELPKLNVRKSSHCIFIG